MRIADRGWRCPFCPAAPFIGPAELEEHLAGEHDTNGTREFMLAVDWRAKVTKLLKQPFSTRDLPALRKLLEER